MRVVVTGCAGFIGYHTTKRLLKEGYKVVGVDDLNDYYQPELKYARLRELGVELHGEGGDDNESIGYESRSGDFRFYKLDIADKQALNKALGGEEYLAICHLAAQAGVRYSIVNPDQYVESNIVGFLNILEYCRHNPTKKLVYASSSSIYGDSSTVPYSESEKSDSPVSLYAATKKANELMAYSYASLYGLKPIGLRFFTVYGEWGRPDMAPFLFTEAIFKGEPIKVFNHGDMSRDFTYINDIVEGVYRVLTAEPKRPREQVGIAPVYNIGNSRPVDLMEFIETVEQLVGKEVEKKMLPMQQGDVKSTWADTSLLREDYGYSPATSLKEGLGRFVQWYREYYGIG